MNKFQRILSAYSLLIVFAATIFATGCKKPSVTFGNSFGSNNNANVVVIDTLTVAASTVYVDSFPTAGTGTMLLGRYKDPYFGVVTASSYLQMAPPSPIPAINNDSRYDSIALILFINKTFYGDTTVAQKFVVSQLQNVIALPNQQFTFYNNSSFAFNPAPLGSSVVAINPTAGYTSQKLNDSLKITLPYSLGLEFFNMMYNNSDTLRNVNTFLGYFKGLHIYTDSTYGSPGAIFGFKDTVIMRMYYHQPGLTLTNKFGDFRFINKPNQFNNISANRVGTPLAQIGPGNTEISSSQTNHAAYIQSASGIQAKVRFPTLSALAQQPGFLPGGILKAQLIVKPVTGTYGPLLALPPRISIANTDYGNLLGSLVPNTFGQAQYGNLEIDYAYGANTSYTYDITPYIKQHVLSGAQNNVKDGIMMFIPSTENYTNFNRVVIGDNSSTNSNYRMLLRVYYISYF